jgi:hypothetical protein
LSDHPVFVRVGDGALFERVHRGKGFRHGHGHFVEIIVWEIHAAEVDAQAD